MGARRVLVTDLDGTLLGDDHALARFRDWFAPSRADHRLVYASGRHLESVRSLVDAGILPEPDAVISGVGVEIHDGSGRSWPGWTERFDGWDADGVRRALRPLTWLEPQADEFQSPLKASYEVTGLSAAERAAILQALRDAGIEATLVYSGDRFVDILPPCAGKGRAAGFLAEGWGISADHVLAFGDSGNDAELLTSGFRGTIVANALPELSRAVGSDVYRSPEPYADGVLDGIRYWSAR
jgi:sucrose-6F-phosphate phosphohydrolase